MKLLCAYLTVINSLAFAAMCLDKHRAKTHGWRLRESSLMLLAAAGGGLGATLAMLLVRHKTNRREFKIGLPVILGVQIILVVIIINCLANR